MYTNSGVFAVGTVSAGIQGTAFCLSGPVGSTTVWYAPLRSFSNAVEGSLDFYGADVLTQ